MKTKKNDKDQDPAKDKAEVKDWEEEWRGKAYSFNSHKACEYFPCHETKDPDNFNCLFCYCPLYALGDNCGGRFSYTEKGYKDCSLCLLPHSRESYGYIIKKYKDIAELVRKSRSEV